MVVNSHSYDVDGDGGLDVHIFRGEILREMTPFGTSLTWVIEYVGEDGVELSRGAKRKFISHDTVYSAFENGTAVVGEPCPER